MKIDRPRTWLGIYIYTPNQIPGWKRLTYGIASLFLITYGLYGLWTNDLVIPGRRLGLHLHGAAAWIMFLAMLSACAVMLSVVVDHYDQENNETKYWIFARAFTILGWGLFGVALLVGLFQ
jgi:hypothetical protein